MQKQGFGEHGQLGRSEFVFAMVADDEVLQQSLKLRGKFRNQRELGLQHFQFNHHMPEQLATGSVGKRTVVCQFVNFSDIVQKDSRQQQVAVDLRVVAADQIAGAKKRDNVIEQAADVGVMQRLGGGSIPISSSDLRIGHEGLYQRLEMKILKCGDKIGKRLPELVNVSRCLGKIVGEFDLRFAQLSQFVDCELEAALVFVDQALDLEKVILLEDVEHLFHVVPHLGLELAAAVPES